MPSKTQLVIGVALLGFGLLMHFIGVATPVWVYKEGMFRFESGYLEYKDQIGLWERCTKTQGFESFTCKTHDTSNTMHEALNASYLSFCCYIKKQL